MNLFEPITNDSVLRIAIRNYVSTSCVSVDEFKSDFMIPKHVRKHIKSYYGGSVMNVHLVLNHFIHFFNVFERQTAIRMLFFDTPSEYYMIIKTFLVFLGVCPKIIRLVPDDIITESIPIDDDIMEILKSL